MIGYTLVTSYNIRGYERMPALLSIRWNSKRKKQAFVITWKKCAKKGLWSLSQPSMYP